MRIGSQAVAVVLMLMGAAAFGHPGHDQAEHVAGGLLHRSLLPQEIAAIIALVLAGVIVMRRWLRAHVPADRTAATSTQADRG